MQEAAAGETPALPACENSLVGSAQPSEPFFDQKICGIKRDAGAPGMLWKQIVRSIGRLAGNRFWHTKARNGAFVVTDDFIHEVSGKAPLEIDYEIPQIAGFVSGVDFCLVMFEGVAHGSIAK